MAGAISLNSVIALMNSAANDSQSAAMSSMNKAESLARQANQPPEELKAEQNPTKGKNEWDAATELIPKIVDGMKPVSSQKQAMMLQGMDSEKQNYAMLAYSMINSKSNMPS